MAGGPNEKKSDIAEQGPPRASVSGVKTLHSLHVAIFPTGTIDRQEMKCAVAATFGQVVGTTYFDSSKADCLTAQLNALLGAVVLDRDRSAHLRRHQLHAGQCDARALN